MTKTVAPSSAPRSMASSTLATARRRTAGSFAVKAPSLKTGWKKRFVVAIGTFMSAFSRAVRKRFTTASRSAIEAPNGTRSLSCRLTP